MFISPCTNLSRSQYSHVMKLRGVNFYWKKEEFPQKGFTDEKQIGFIAQEMEKIYPELVITQPDGYKSVDYSKLTPVLVEAIKEQQKLIHQLTETVEGMQKQIITMRILMENQQASKK